RRVHETIADAARRAGRDPAAIRLIAVSKTMPAAVIEAAWRAGQTEFGENTVQDALAKIPSFQGRNLVWHFIGHLQSNKAKFIPDHFSWVHSIDSVALAHKLSQVCQRKGVRVNALVQINVSGEVSKYGISPDTLYPLMDELLSLELSGIRLRGLMTLGRLNATDDELRTCFAQLRRLRDDCQRRFGLSDFGELSMGMTQDYRLAVAEGATM
ncbi:MAG: YggS family pyridoxal phosphate-dependent enzyme, partial [Burkholderiales bacterium]|nr:YggS family pyridoxal phosphate-dependent enzyme [Burkholderiales bacterium]